MTSGKAWRCPRCKKKTPYVAERWGRCEMCQRWIDLEQREASKQRRQQR